jgi:hypothetical protein
MSEGIDDGHRILAPEVARNRSLHAARIRVSQWVVGDVGVDARDALWAEWVACEEEAGGGV